MGTTEFTILMPCLNEEKSLEFCIREAQEYIGSRGLSAEILIADNGSTDRSAEIARSLGARVVQVPEKGYGSALRGGIAAARGTYVIMGDCDGSYDFSRLDRFTAGLRQGFDLVIGNRLRGHPEKGAMPFSHRYIGVPVLSLLASLRFHTPYLDYHCGLRGVKKSSHEGLILRSTGMEYATEMIGALAAQGCTIKQFPIDLRRDLRGGPPHLHGLRDGIRHLKVIAAGVRGNSLPGRH